MNKQLYYKQFSYIDSLNTTERRFKIERQTDSEKNRNYKRNIKEIENIYHINDWKPSNKKLPLFSNIPLLSSNKKNMDYTLMKQNRKLPKYLNKKYTQQNKKKTCYNEKYNLSRKTMKDNWRYITFLYKNKHYLKQNLFSKITDRFMNIIDDNKKLWIGADFSPNIPLE